MQAFYPKTKSIYQNLNNQRTKYKLKFVIKLLVTLTDEKYIELFFSKPIPIIYEGYVGWNSFFCNFNFFKNFKTYKFSFLMLTLNFLFYSNERLFT